MNIRIISFLVVGNARKVFVTVSVGPYEAVVLPILAGKNLPGSRNSVRLPTGTGRHAALALANCERVRRECRNGM